MKSITVPIIPSLSILFVVTGLIGFTLGFLTSFQTIVIFLSSVGLTVLDSKGEGQ